MNEWINEWINELMPISHGIKIKWLVNND